MSLDSSYSPRASVVRERVFISSGFTLVELLTVVAVIGILAGLSIPVVSSIREKGRQSVCASNLRQIMAATLFYLQDNRNALPLVVDEAQQRWATQIQPYLNPGAAAKSIDPLSVFRCPSDAVARISSSAADSTWCSYGLNIRVHVAGNVANTTRKRFSLITNPSRTILYGDVWNPANTVFQSLSLLSFMGNFHGGKGSNYVFADGHVEFLEQSVVTAVDPVSGRQPLIYIPD